VRLTRVLGFSLSAVVLVACAGRPSNLPQGFQEFRDSNERFTVLYPNNWTFQPGPDQGVKLSDPADASYQLTVAVGKVPAQIRTKGKPTDLTSVSQFNRSEFGRRISQSLVPRSGTQDSQLPQTAVEIRREAQRTDPKGRLYYTYEMVIATAGVSRHTLITAVIDQGSLYTVIVGCSDDNWPSRKEKVMTIADSFQVLPTS